MTRASTKTATIRSCSCPAWCSPSSRACISDRLSKSVQYKGIGIRIEDDILVTEDGYRNLSVKVPSDPEEIEALVGTLQF